VTKDARVLVDWVPEEQGGRNLLPDSEWYITISRFSDDGPKWPDGAWSVGVRFDEPPRSQGTPSHGTARFMMEDAPHERLQPGTRFELFDGPQKTADVEVLDSE